MEKIKLNFSHNQSVANIHLSNGKGNVIDGEMMAELLDVFEKFKTYSNLKLITFQGEGKHFSFGASVEEHTRTRAPLMLKSFHALFFEIIRLSIPTMAKITGQCLGGGMELALVCNFLFADKTAILGQPEIVLGVFPPPASIILPLKIGNARAEDLLLTGRNIDATESEQIGLINKVYDDKESLERETESWIVKNIIPKSASSLRFGVQAARINFNQTISSNLPVLEAMYLQKLMETHDANEGINSFLEKRQPVWENNGVN